MQKLLSFSFTHPKTLLFLCLVFTVVLGLGIPKLEKRNSFSGELPKDDPINQGVEAAKQHFGERSIVLIGIESENCFRPEIAKKIISLSEELANLPGVMPDEVLSLATLRNISNRDWGLETGGFLDELPQQQQEWLQLQADVEGNPLVNGRLVSKGGKLAVIAAPLAEGFEGGVVYDALTELSEKYQGDEKIHITGAPVLVEDVQRGISADSRTFIPIAIVLIFVGFYLCFRRIEGVLLPVGMVIMSIIWTMGFMGYIGLPVTVVSNALPVIMVAVASSYGIHFMNAYYRLAKAADSGRELSRLTLEKMGMPILITGVTSSLGSASLLIFNITSLREFGIIGAVGFLIATFICLTFLPAACALLRPPKSTEYQEGWIVRPLQLITRWVQQQRLVVAGIYLLILPACVYFSMQINIGDDYLRFFPKEHAGRVAAETFNEQLGGVRVMDIVVDATAYGGIKDAVFFEDMAAFQDFLGTLPGVGSTNSYRDVVEHLGKTLNDAKWKSPTNSEIAQYLMLHEMSATPGEVFALRTEDDMRAKIQVFLKSSDPEVHQALYEQIQQEAPRFFEKEGEALLFGGDVMHRIALGKYIVKGKIENILLALFIVGLTCLVVFRSATKSLLTLLPIAISLLMVFGLMGLIGIRLGISTSLLTAMVVGIGIDFAVHYLVGYYRIRKRLMPDEALEYTSMHTGRAIAYDAVSNIVGFSVLSFSGFLPVQHFGWLLAFSMLLIFLNTLLLYPLVLYRPLHRAVAAG